MKKLILLLTLTVITAISYGQSFHKDPKNDSAYKGVDTTLPYTYVNVLLTDAANGIVNLKLKMYVSYQDYGDSTLGAASTMQLFKPNGKRFTLYGDAMGTQFRSKTYQDWNIADDADVYRITTADWAVRNIYFTFLP